METKAPSRATLASWVSLGALVALVVLGVALRLRQYLFNRSLWLDEAKVAISVVTRDVGELITVPLAHGQSAPPGFLVSTRAAVVAFGPGEMALRLTPLIAGVLALLVAFVLARRELKSVAAQVTFVGSVALSPTLIYYASELKQYSSDALFALAMLLAVSYRTTRHGTWLLAGVGSVAIVCSLPALFVAAPAALLILYEAIRSKWWRQALTVGVAWISAAAVHGAYLFHAGAESGPKVLSWGIKGSFAPLLPSSWAELQWYPTSLYRLTYLIFGEKGHAATTVSPSSFYPLGWLLVLMLILAVAAALISRRRTAIVALGAILVALLASGLKIYPFAGRLLMFLVPVTLFIIAAGIDELDRVARPVVAGAVAVLLLGIVIPAGVEAARSPEPRSDMRGALELVNRKFVDGDAVIVWYPSGYHYYAHKLTAPDVFVLELELDAEASAIIEDIKTRGYRRGWFVAAHRLKEARVLIEEIAESVPIVLKWRAPGTRVVLFDFAAR